MTRTLFRETQRFRQLWLWALLMATTVPASLLVTVAVVTDTEGPVTDTVPVLVVAYVLLWGPLVGLYRARLVTEVRPNGLAIQLFPLQLSARTVPCESIEEWTVTSVSAKEYGGIGVRHNPTVYRWGVSFEEPKAYLATGGEGLRIDRRDDRPLVVGTRRPEELSRALERACPSGRG